MKSHAITYKPFDEKKNYIAYCETLFSSSKEWRFSISAEYENISLIVDVNLTKGKDIELLKTYLETYGVKETWWRLSCGENYHKLDWMKKMYGNWENLKYLNNINL